MSSVIWFICSFLAGLFLITFVPVLFYFNPICGLVFGIIFFKLFVLSVQIFKDERAAQKWCDDVADSPLLNNDPQNIVSLPAHPLHHEYTRK